MENVRVRIPVLLVGESAVTVNSALSLLVPYLYSYFASRAYPRTTQETESGRSGRPALRLPESYGAAHALSSLGKAGV